MKFLNYSLSLSLAARRDINIINKFHINKIAIKQKDYVCKKLFVKRGMLCCQRMRLSGLYFALCYPTNLIYHLDFNKIPANNAVQAVL